MWNRLDKWFMKLLFNTMQYISKIEQKETYDFKQGRMSALYIYINIYIYRYIYDPILGK